MFAMSMHSSSKDFGRQLGRSFRARRERRAGGVGEDRGWEHFQGLRVKAEPLHWYHLFLPTTERSMQGWAGEGKADLRLHDVVAVISGTRTVGSMCCGPLQETSCHL